MGIYMRQDCTGPNPLLVPPVSPGCALPFVGGGGGIRELPPLIGWGGSAGKRRRGRLPGVHRAGELGETWEGTGRSPMAEPCPGPPSAPSAPQCSQLPPPTLEGLIPPSHFVLRPRSLGVELEAERGRVHELEVELKALKGRSQHLEAELEAERRRSQHLEAELEAERRRSQQLEAELETEKGRSQSLEAELKSERGRSQGLGVELDALRGRGQRLEAELDAEKGRSQILETELETLRRRGLGPEEVEQSPEQVLLGRWRQKVFQLLLQVRLQQGQELQLQGQVRSLGAAVAAGSRQVSLLELRLRQGEQERQALSQERLRAEAAEEELGKLGQALSRLLGTLGVALADVTVAVGALGTLSERLERAQHRLQALVASGQLRWQRELEGTAGDSSTVAPEVTSEQATKGGDGTRPCLGTVSLAPLVTHLQALGAAILGDIGDPAVPAPPWGHR
ncbi:coiled-coil alpha-helical rod protein 1-like [Serinus canaria]|uniref:coiled-coil alpha-helical rod protein 1-like n=1 Tax=Serinus canaria TaxID=9135 RepID=UPI0021CC7E7A|nr:coiled-coil alpha-helical rod protein 1-like [Serinus canaria]